MKKQIISLLILISLSFQATYPALDPVKQKKEDTIPWWRIRALYKAFNEARKELDLCGAQQCKQEEAEADEAWKAYRQIPLGKKLIFPSLRLNHARKYLAAQSCLRLRCKQEYTKAHMLDDKLRIAILGVSFAALVATLGLKVVLEYHIWRERNPQYFK